MTNFAREVDATIAGTLNPGERVIWRGHCQSRLGRQQKAARATIGTVLIVTPFVLIGVLLIVVGLEGPDGRIIPGAILSVVGMSALYSMVSERFHDGKMYCRKQTAYVLTDQRAFVLKHCRTDAPMRSVEWRFVDDVRAESVGPDGRGTVRFLHWDPMARRWDTPLQFYMVGAAYRVAEWAQAAHAQATG